MPDFSEWRSAHADRHHLRVRDHLIDGGRVYETEESPKRSPSLSRSRPAANGRCYPKT